MANVRPVYFNSGNIQRMDDTMLGLLKDVFRYQFQQLVKSNHIICS